MIAIGETETFEDKANRLLVAALDGMIIPIEALPRLQTLAEQCARWQNEEYAIVTIKHRYNIITSITEQLRKLHERTIG